LIRPVRSDGSIDTGGAFVPIARPRVVERLAAAARQPIVLIAAPAGYGKSVALRQYLETLPGPWIRFDTTSEHAGLLGFLRGLSEAIAPHAPDAGRTLAGAYDRSRVSSTPALDLAMWMHAHLRGFGGVLAIDDLHVAEGDPTVAAFLVALIERSKGGIRWVIASRSTGGLPVGTWLAYGDTDLAIDERDLRFSLDEAKEAARASRIAIRADELAELLELTDGWPTALSFALRSSTRSADLRSVAATTREMIYRYFAEQVYAEFSEGERDLLAVATVLPAIDIDVLEAAGFDRALEIVEGLRERTAFIYAESPRVFRCHDLFREFLRRVIDREGRKHFAAVHDRAARALESTGNVERALAAYGLAEARDDVLRVLQGHGFDLIERARGDVVAHAIDDLDESVRRENARVLALRAMLQSTAGKNARAETLFRRAILRGGSDRELVAIASLRFAILLMNLGRDAGELLEPLALDPEQSHNHRAEALSIVTAQRAAGGDLERARIGIERLEELLVEVDSDASRAKVLQRMGLTFAKIGEVERAGAVLLEAAELADDLHMYSLSSRACAVLSNLALHENDDVAKHLWYAQQSSEGATKAGDVFDLQVSLFRMLIAEMRLGNAERSREIEAELARLGTSDSPLAVYAVANRAVRAGWEGRFEEAHRSLFACLERIHYDFDRVSAGAHCAVYLALLGRREESVALVRDVVGRIEGVATRGIYRMRAVALARMLCAIAEAINGRVTQAERLARGIARRTDPVLTLAGRAAEAFASARRRGMSDGSQELLEAASGFTAFAYGDIARLLEASAENVRSVDNADLAETLTPAERNVLRRLADGASPKEIAAVDGRSVYTVQAHIANAISKLGCHGRGEAIALAQRKGWLEQRPNEV
jgi:LuxR family transcriptional regulator, maltose regulon positive regulatory protein